MNANVNDKLHTGMTYLRGISPAVAGSDDTAYVSQIIDTKNYKNVEFVMLTGSLADANATFAVLVEEGDASNLSDAAAVADADLNGTEAAAGFTFAADNTIEKIGYRGLKRYVRLTVTPSGNTGDVYLACIVVCEPGDLLPV